METDPGQPSQEHSVMESLRNSRLGVFVTAGLASLTLFTSTAEAGVLAFGARPVSAEGDAATLINPPEAQASYTPTRPCKSTDSKSPKPQWHANYNFKTPNGKENVHDVKPGGLTKFVVRVAGGNLEAFDMDMDIYKAPNAIEVLPGGSHPTWSKAGGEPHWAIKELCHWKDKREISFLVKVGQQAKIGERLCMPFDVWGKTAEMVYPVQAPYQYRCLKVE